MLKRGAGVRAFPTAHVKTTDKTRCLTFCRHSVGWKLPPCPWGHRRVACPWTSWRNMAKHCKSRQFRIVSVELLLEGWMMLDVGLMHKLHTGLSKGKSPWFKTISKSGMSTVALCFCHGSNLQSAPQTCRCFCNELNWRCSQDPMIAADAGRRSQFTHLSAAPANPWALVKSTWHT